MQHRSNEKRLIKVFLFIIFSLYLTTGRAAIKIVSIDNASQVTGGDTATPTVYGGLAGAANQGSCSSGKTNKETCNSCGGDGLKACNLRRIYDDLEFSVTFQSDALDSGVAMLGKSTSDGSAVTSSGLSSTATVSAKNTNITITLRWRDICAALTSVTLTSGSTSSTIYHGCEEMIPTAAQLTGTLKLGIAKSGTALASTDEQISIVFVVQRYAGQESNNSEISTISDCSSATKYGVCYFVLGSGDQKALINRILVSGTGFPQGTGIKYSHFRFLYRASTVAASESEFDGIMPNSPGVNVAIVGNSLSGGTVTASPKRITGLTNDLIYYFRAAVVDEAGNIGGFSDATLLGNCDASDLGGSSSPIKCHMAYPGEVVGILADKANCFIATAAWGSTMAPQVSLFRAFRDDYLVNSWLGRKFVRFYYRNSPPLAAFIAKSDSLRALSRVVLTPPLYFAKIAVAHGFMIALLSLFATISAVFALLAIGRKSWRRRKSQRGLRA